MSTSCAMMARSRSHWLWNGQRFPPRPRLFIVPAGWKWSAVSRAIVPCLILPPRSRPSGSSAPLIRRNIPYLYSASEKRALLTAARQLTPVDGLRPHTYAALLGLLMCSGLRIAEALHLGREDT